MTIAKISLYCIFKNASSNSILYDKERHRTKETTQKKPNAACPRTRMDPLPLKFLATANEIGQRKTQLQRYSAEVLQEHSAH